MSMTSRSALSGVICTALALAAPLSAQVQSYTVTEAHALCIQINADAYLADDRPIYVITAEGCITGRDLGDQMTASSASGEFNILGGGDAAGEDRVADVVVLTPEQVRCLRDRYETVAARKGGDAPVLVELQFDGC